MSTTAATLASLVDDDDDDDDDADENNEDEGGSAPDAAADAMRLLRGRDGAISIEGRREWRGMTRDDEDTPEAMMTLSLGGTNDDAPPAAAMATTMWGRSLMLTVTVQK
jgi:hypothetical protein